MNRLPRLRTTGGLRRLLAKPEQLARPSYFFAPDTMRFFNSVVHDDLLMSTYTPHKLVAYFVTSEQFEDEARDYSVRRVTLELDAIDKVWDHIETVGDPHASLNDALQAARSLIQ